MTGRASEIKRALKLKHANREPDPIFRLFSPEIGYRGVGITPSTGSTNADLKMGVSARRDRTALIADHQTEGRGRVGRTWTAPPGTSVAISAFFRPPAAAASRWTWLPLITGMAVVDGLAELAPTLRFRLKWPNDVLVGDGKISGILAERVETGLGPACILGMGINLGMTEAQLPVHTATSLAILLGDQPSPPRDEVAVTVLTHLARHYDTWAAAPDTVALATEYRAQSETLGRRVRVLLGGGAVVDGVAQDVDSDGRLLIERSDGSLETFAAGDVEHLR